MSTKPQTASAPQQGEVKVAKVATNKQSPKVMLINRAIEAVRNTKTIDEAVKALEALKVSSGRTSTNYDEITVQDKDGKVTHIFCTASKLWFPVTEFGKANNKIGFSPINKKIKMAVSKFNKSKKDSISALTSDFMSGAVEAGEYKSSLSKLQNSTFDVKSVTLTGGSTVKPKGA